MANTTIPKSYDSKYGGQDLTSVDQATQNAQLAEVLALAHSHANKALLDTYSFSNADVLDAIAKKHEPVTVAAGNPFGLSGQELSFLYDDTYLQILSNELSVKAGDLLLGANTNGFSKTGTGKTLGSDITLNLPQRIDTAATVRYENETIGGAYDALYKLKVYGNGNVTGNWTVDGNVIIGGNLTVAGDSVTFEVGTLVVEDKNIEIAKISTPTDTFANGGGLILKGSTDHTVLWDSTYQNWTSSEHVNVASGKSYKVNNTVVIDSSRVGYLTKLNVNGPADTANALNLNGNMKVWGSVYSSNSSVIDPYNGYYLGVDGSVFNRISASELHVKNFIADYQLALLGGLRVVKSSAKLAADLTISGGTGTLQIEEIPGSAGYLFESGDHIVIRTEQHNGTAFNVVIIAGTVNAGTRNDTDKTQSYTLTKLSGSGTSAAKGSVALDYGKSGDGIVEIVAKDEFGRTTIRIADFYDTPWTDLTVRTQLGSLEGLTDDTYGALSRHGLYTNVAYLVDDIYIGDTAVIGGVGVGMLNGMTALFHFDDNVYDSIGNARPVYSGTYSETSYGLLTATGLTASKANGKFGGGIAVEEAATNTGANVYFDSADGNPASSGSSWTNYSAGAGAGARTFAYAVSGIYNIKKALRLTKTGGTTSSDRIGVYQSNAAWNGVTHTFSFYVKILSKEAGCRLRLFNGSANVQTWLLDDYAVGQWIRLSGTTNYAGSLRYIWLDTGNADILITAFQAEAKSYATSFCEGTRAAGALSFSGLINPSAFTVSARVYINFAAQAGFGRVFEISSDANNRLFVAQNSTSNFLRLYFMKSGTVIFDLITSTLSITADWHLISLKYDGANYYLFVDGAQIYSPLSSTLIDSAWTLKLGYGVTGTYLNAIFDETAIYNRAITAKEEQRIHYSNQPFNESAGLTVISGNHIKTGIIQSENYVNGTSGSMWNLNTGYLETADGWFRGTITASAGTIGGWTLASDTISGLADANNGVILSATASMRGMVVKNAASEVLKVGYFTNASESYSTEAMTLPDWVIESSYATGVTMSSLSGTSNYINNASAVNDSYAGGYRYGTHIYKSIDVNSVKGRTFEFSFDIREVSNSAGSDLLNVIAYIKYNTGAYGSAIVAGLQDITPASVQDPPDTPGWNSKTIRANIPNSATDVKVYIYASRYSLTNYNAADVYFRNLAVKYYSKSYIEINQNGLKMFNSPINKIQLDNTTSLIYAPEMRAGVMAVGDSGDWQFVETQVLSGDGTTICSKMSVRYKGAEKGSWTSS